MVATHDKDRSFVLIVPLWNWNKTGKYSLVIDKYVLIVPLWNWNWVLCIIINGITCFNRTFMELKLEMIKMIH